MFLVVKVHMNGSWGIFMSKEGLGANKDKISELNGLGDDRNLSNHGHIPHYWYSIGDGFRLALWLRKSYLDYGDNKHVNPGEEYIAVRENNNRIVVTDPYCIENFKIYLDDDISKITATDKLQQASSWSKMPTTIIIPLLSGLHWRVVKIGINYEDKKATILFDDPYGKDAFPNQLKSDIITYLKGNIQKLISKQNKNDSFTLTEDIDISEKELDQQGHGKNSWDCGPIAFSNVEDYISAIINATNLNYTIGSYEKQEDGNTIHSVRRKDIERYSEVIENSVDQDKLDKIKKLIAEVIQKQINQLKNLGLSEDIEDILEGIKSNPFAVSLFHTVLGNKRIFEGKDSKEKYTPEEIKYAYQIVTQELKEYKESEISQSDYQLKVEPIDYLENILGKTVPYSATKTAEGGHPNKNGNLNKIIGDVLKDKNVKTLEEFHSEVYKSLGQQESKGKKYTFHCFNIEKITAEKITADSDNLLFYLVVNNEVDKIKLIIKQYDFNLLTVQDSIHNSILHIAAYHGHHVIIKEIFKKYKYKYAEEFTQLLNHRNDVGTNPLGMAFLKKLTNENFSRVINLFVLEKNFKINDYLNNKVGMDYTSKSLQEIGALQEIGGFNILHMTLISDTIKNKQKVLDILFQRNYKIGWNNSDDCCNFFYPSLNPKYHMNSPNKLADAKILESLKSYQSFQMSAEDIDDSGDSSDEETPAYFYKRELLKLRQVADDNEKSDDLFDLKGLNSVYEKGDNILKKLKDLHGNVVIPHFHGVPFMQGQYTNHQRREVAKKLCASINKNWFDKFSDDNVEKENDGYLDVIMGLHSRTSTATNGIETLYHLIKAPERTLKSLRETDNVLAEYLSSCYKKEKVKFLEAIKKYVYDFSKNPIEEVWQTLACIEKPPENIIKYRFPFISSSKAPDHAMKFAIGKNVETQSLDEKPMFPKYDDIGTPKHRLAGLLFITMHSLKEINLMERDNQMIDITKLLKTGALKTSNKRIDNQIESTFFGSIKSDGVVAVIPIIYPNFSKPFKKEYHNTVYGLIIECNKPGPNPSNHYTIAKEHFKGKSFPSCYKADKSGNIAIAGKVLMPAFVKLALELSRAIAENSGKILCYYSPDGQLEHCSIDYTKLGNTYYSKIQLNIKDKLPKKDSDTKEEIIYVSKALSNKTDFNQKKKELDETVNEFTTGAALEPHEQESYWYEYSKRAMDKLLQLRLESVSIDDKLAIVSPNFIFDGSRDSAKRLSMEIISKNEEKILINLNLYNKHWVGIVINKSHNNIDLHYMDSEQEAIPLILKEELLDALILAYPSRQIHIIKEELESQKYNNCGLEVIENFILYLTGDRLSQEDALPVQSLLFEDSIILE